MHIQHEIKNSRSKEEIFFHVFSSMQIKANTSVIIEIKTSVIKLFPDNRIKIILKQGHLVLIQDQE